MTFQLHNDVKSLYQNVNLISSLEDSTMEKYYLLVVVVGSQDTVQS